MRLFRSPRRVTLRVTAGEPGTPLTFDAMLVLGHGRMHARTLVGEHTPFELELPDEDCTAVVRASDPNLPCTVEYAVERAGVRQLYGRSGQPLAILERRGDGIVVGGLPMRNGLEGDDSAVAAPGI